jgi:hypothetical protein
MSRAYPTLLDPMTASSDDIREALFGLAMDSHMGRIPDAAFRTERDLLHASLRVAQVREGDALALEVDP